MMSICNIMHISGIPGRSECRHSDKPLHPPKWYKSPKNDYFDYVYSPMEWIEIVDMISACVYFVGVGALRPTGASPQNLRRYRRSRADPDWLQDGAVPT